MRLSVDFQTPIEDKYRAASELGRLEPMWSDMSVTEKRHRAGQGNWGAFRALGGQVSDVLTISEAWKSQVRGIDRAWLCWNVQEDWCFVQQRLVEEAGWTPLVGWDPRVGPPKRVAASSVLVDFNAGLGLPVLYPHFPLEFVFSFVPKLAFWHSDLLLPLDMMRKIADTFDSQSNNSTSAVWTFPGLRYLLTRKCYRYWELIGCTTSQASRHQFEHGCGWWMEFWNHPNCPSDIKRRQRMRWYWDHGTGIYFWAKRCGGMVNSIKSSLVSEGHFTKIGNPNYVRTFDEGSSDAQRSMSTAIVHNFDLLQACRKLGIENLLDER